MFANFSSLSHLRRKLILEKTHKLSELLILAVFTQSISKHCHEMKKINPKDDPSTRIPSN